MKWIVQTNLQTELNQYNNLVNALNKTNTEYQIVKTIPFTSETIPEVNYKGDVFICGANSLKENKNYLNWNIGYIDNNLDYELYNKYYSTFMLNYNSQINTIENIVFQYDKFFIRPTLDSKSFAGQIMTWEAFTNWREKLQKISEVFSTLKLNDKVLISPLLDIKNEYRFWIVNSKIITYSSYKINKKFNVLEIVPKHVIDFVEALLKIWVPNIAFCIDVCELEDNSLKIIELNSINSSGFYNANLNKLVEAINSI